MNFDWPGNNNKLFKAKSADGKWRHIWTKTNVNPCILFFHKNFDEKNANLQQGFV